MGPLVGTAIFTFSASCNSMYFVRRGSPSYHYDLSGYICHWFLCPLYCFVLTAGSLAALMLKNPPVMQETWVRSLGWEDPLEKEMFTHYSILAWEIPWSEEPGRLLSMGLQRVRQDWVSTHTGSFALTCLPEVTRLRLLVGSFSQYVAVCSGSGLLLPVSQEELVKYEPNVAPVLFQPPSLFLAGIWVIWATGVLLSLLLCWRSESLFPRDVKEESKNSWWFFYEWSFTALNM